MGKLQVEVAAPAAAAFFQPDWQLSFEIKLSQICYKARAIRFKKQQKSKSILAISQKSKTLNKSCPQRHVGALVLGKLLQFFLSLQADMSLSLLDS